MSAQTGCRTVVVEISDEVLQGGLDGLRRTLQGLVEKGKLDAKGRDDALARISGTTRLEDFRDCDLVIEAMMENQQLKNETFRKLDAVCPPHALLATNTSSCSVTAMAAATKRSARCSVFTSSIQSR